MPERERPAMKRAAALARLIGKPAPLSVRPVLAEAAIALEVAVGLVVQPVVDAPLVRAEQLALAIGPVVPVRVVAPVASPAEPFAARHKVGFFIGANGRTKRMPRPGQSVLVHGKWRQTRERFARVEVDVLGRDRDCCHRGFPSRLVIRTHQVSHTCQVRSTLKAPETALDNPLSERESG